MINIILAFMPKYMIAVNILAFLIFTIDFQIYKRGGEGIKPAIICEIITVIGGAAGTMLAFILWDRHLNKTNMTWRIYATTLMIIQVVICLAIFGPRRLEVQKSIENFLTVNKWLLIYLLVINVVTFVMFGIDKWKAVHGQWRIKIVTLLGLSFLGGAVGGLLAMYTFRHKTQKAYFTFGLPMILLAQVVLLIYLKSAGIL